MCEGIQCWMNPASWGLDRFLACLWASRARHVSSTAGHRISSGDSATWLGRTVPGTATAELKLSPKLLNCSDTDRTFGTWRFGTGIPVLATPPRLLAAISGDLRLVGAAPLTPEGSASRSKDWQRAVAAPEAQAGPDSG
jgi:hypothetical protein